MLSVPPDCGPRLSPTDTGSGRWRPDLREDQSREPTPGTAPLFPALSGIHSCSPWADRGRGTARPSGIGTLRADLLDLGHRLAQLTEPAVRPFRHEADAPGERLGPRAGDARVDEGVEHLPLGLAQPGHHRRREMGVQDL